MTPELAYFIKINIAIALFYAFYRLFFCKGTFFQWRRTTLLCFFAVSIVYPLLNLQEWITDHEPVVAMADLYATVILPELTINASQTETVNWQKLTTDVLKYMYGAGILFFLLRVVIKVLISVNMFITLYSK